MAEDPFSGTGPAYLHHLLLAALTGPRAAGNLAPGRLVTQILLGLHAAGGERIIGRYMAPVPGVAASFVVLGDDEEISSPSVTAAEALTVAVRRATTTGVEVVAESAGGVRRRVFEGAPDRPVRFLWPEAVDYHGDDDACTDALERWAWLMDRWRAEPVVNGPADQALTAGPGPPSVVTPAVRPDAVTASASVVPTEAIADAVRGALGEVTVEVDLGAVERLVADALDAAMQSGAGPGTTRMSADWGSGLAASGPALAELVDRIADQVAKRVSAVQAGSDPQPRTTAGGLAAGGVTAELDQRTMAQMASSLASLVPSPNATAEAVAEQVRQLIGPALHAISERRIDDDRLARATLAAAAAELHLQLEALTDRVRSGTRSLEALADELAARERTASSHVDRVVQRIEGSLERLGRHVDERLDAMSASPPDEASGAELRSLASDVAALVNALGGNSAGSGRDETISLGPTSYPA